MKKTDPVYRSKTLRIRRLETDKKKNVFLRRVPDLFFRGHFAIRFRLDELEGVEPLRKLVRPKLVPGRCLEVW